MSHSMPGEEQKELSRALRPRTTAKVNGATKLYSDDEDVIKFAGKTGIEVVSTWTLPLPLAKQMKFEGLTEDDSLVKPPTRSIRLKDE